MFAKSNAANTMPEASSTLSQRAKNKISNSEVGGDAFEMISGATKDVMRGAKDAATPSEGLMIGEEFLVTKGAFQSGTETFPLGTYVRRPHSMRGHASAIEDGSIVLLNRWVMREADDAETIIDTLAQTPIYQEGQPSVQVLPLYTDDYEAVRIEIWDKDTFVSLDHTEVSDIFVIDGSFTESNVRFTKHSWLRQAKGQEFAAAVGKNGARVWVKSKLSNASLDITNQ